MNKKSCRKEGDGIHMIQFKVRHFHTNNLMRLERILGMISQPLTSTLRKITHDIM